MAQSSDVSPSKARLGCKKANCSVASGGLCLDGFEDPATECDAAISLPADDLGEAQPELQSTPADIAPVVPLYHGDRLTLADARAAAGSRPMRVVSFVGEVDAGKTTLVATIFDLYQAGEFAGCTFAGTRTPIGFDKRCHQSRTSSGLRKPTTPRTPIFEGLHFLHLSLKPGDGRETVDILLSDRSGEHFREARKTSDESVALSDLPRATLVVFLVNGALLSVARTRNRERHNVSVTARDLFERGLIRPDTQVTFVLTKMDTVLAAGPLGSEAQRTFDALVQQFQRNFGHRWRIASMCIAARADDGSAPLGEGVDRLVRLMVDVRDPASATGEETEAPPLTPYDRFILPLIHGGVP